MRRDREIGLGLTGQIKGKQGCCHIVVGDNKLGVCFLLNLCDRSCETAGTVGAIKRVNLCREMKPASLEQEAVQARPWQEQ